MNTHLMRSFARVSLTLLALLVGCSSPPQPNNLSPEQAGQIVAQATTEMAATNARALGLEQTSDARTETAFQIGIDATRVSIAKTQQADNMQATEVAHNKTATVAQNETNAFGAAMAANAHETATTSAGNQQGTLQATLDISREESASQAVDTVTSSVSILVIGAAVVVIMVSLIGAVMLRDRNAANVREAELRAKMEIEADRLRHEAKIAQDAAEHEMRLMQMKLDAFSKAMRETSQGPVAFLPDGTAVAIATLGPSGPITNSKIVSDAPRAPVIVTDPHKGSYVLEYEPGSDDERAMSEEMLRWIEVSMEWWNRQNKKGSGQIQLKSWHALAADGISGWHSDRQRAITAAFADSLTTRTGAGKGTYSNDSLSLGDLRVAILRGTIRPRLQQKAPHPEVLEGQFVES